MAAELAITWREASSIRSPPGREAPHVWMAVVSELSPAFVDGAVPAPEREESGRFRLDADRRRFLASRAVLRTLLGTYLGARPEKLQFATGPHGKPRLAGRHARDGMHFNLSHSGDVVLLAFAHGIEVGVDVETTQHLTDLDILAPTVCSAQELARLLAMAPSLRPSEFTRLWTCKEAVAKALGLGVSLDPRGIEITLAPEAEGAPEAVRKARVNLLPILGGPPVSSGEGPERAGRLVQAEDGYEVSPWSLMSFACSARSLGAIAEPFAAMVPQFVRFRT